MSHKENTENNRDPEISEGDGSEVFRVSDNVSDLVLPDLGSKVSRDKNAGAGEDKSFGRTIEVSEIKRVGVVSFPS